MECAYVCLFVRPSVCLCLFVFANTACTIPLLPLDSGHTVTAEYSFGVFPLAIATDFRQPANCVHTQGLTTHSTPPLLLLLRQASRRLEVSSLGPVGRLFVTTASLVFFFLQSSITLSLSATGKSRCAPSGSNGLDSIRLVYIRRLSPPLPPPPKKKRVKTSRST